MKVVHAFAPAPFGGLETVVGQLAAAQHRAGRCAGVVGLRADGVAAAPVLAELRGTGVPVAEVVTAGRAYLRQRREVAAALAGWGADILHCHGYHADVVLSGVGKRLGMKVVSTAHGFTRGGGRNRVYEWLQMRRFRKLDAVVAVSRVLAAELAASGVPVGRVHQIPNAFAPAGPAMACEDARRELGLEPGQWVIGWVGRLGAEKGPDLMLEAVARLAARSDLRVVFIGAGRMEAGLRDLAGRLGVAGQVVWAGRREGAGRLFGAFDLFAMSSRTEGTPMVLLEAMAAGVPVVATAVGGIPDVVGPEGGWLVPPDDPDALATALDAARRDPAGRASRVRSGTHRLAVEYSVDRWLERHDTMYRAVLGTDPERQVRTTR